MKRFYTLLVILTLFSSWIHSATASDEADWMPDANLRTAVRSALNLNNNDALTQAGMANLTGLTARNAQISSLTGLEHATNLQKLDLRDNTISNISTLSGLTNLESLKLKGNNISSVSALSGLTNLTLLNLKENNISNISDLSGLTNLEHLRVDANSITDVQPLTRLVNLERLWITGNSLTNAHLLSSLTGLTYIDIPIPDPPDTTAPSVTVSVPSGTQNGAFSVTITFTESVSNFVQSDVSLSGSAASITSWRANSGNTVYTATITPTASGTVTIGVAANVATDAANNQNTAATSKTVTVSVDTTSPYVTVSVPSGVQNGAFDATITFTETVSGFTQSDVSLSGSAASITGWRANSDNTVYTATITPTASGTVTIGVAANVATDAANNPNTAAISQTVSVDVDKPSVTIGVPSGTQTSAFNATITFMESVSNFVQSDVSLTGSAASITSWRAHSGNTVYTATITPTTSGSVTIGVAANVATDAANNANTAATSKTVSIDVDKPTVTIGVPSGTQTGAFDVTITFSETVSGFVGSDVSLTGSAASITGWRANSDNTVYTATITPTASGTVTIGVAANVATDAANNQNTAATSKSVTVSVDTTSPDVTVSVPSGVQNGRFSVTITFTEAVSDFVQSEVSLSGSAVSITSWRANSANTVYTATITPTASGTVTIGVAANVATDAANNANTAATSKTVSVDVDKPSVTIGVPSGTQTGAFDVTITFSETVSGFVGSDVSLTGSAASITAWSANTANTVYTTTITPTASGTVTIGVAANVATDAANNANTAATSKTVTVNIPDPIPDPSTWMPDANLRTAVRSALGLGNNDTLTQAGMANLTGLTARNAQISSLTGLEHATNLTSLDLRDNTISNISALSGLTNLESLKLKGNNISSVSGLSRLTNLTLLNLKENNISSISTLSGLTNLEHLRVDANSITDVQPLTRLVNLERLWIAGNSLTNAHLLSSLTGLTYIDIPIPDPPDTTAPSVTVSVPSGTQNGAFSVTITFTESVSNFVQSDVSLRGSAASITSWRANSGNTVYTATITPTARGTVTIGVDANVATDAANNQNTAATSKTVTVDVDKPSVTIGVPSGTQTGAFNATITFSETVSGFTQSDVSLRGSAASITSWRANNGNTIYTATITPTASGTVTIGVAANVATDAVNNQNTAATSKTVTVSVDTTSPGVTVSVPSGVQNGAFNATITFTESVSNFVQSDVSLSGSAASITSWRANSGNTIYTATITPTASGTVTVSVNANVATDAADNPNTAATSQTVDIDVEAPGASITVPSEAQRGAFAALITFTEAVSGFEQTDLSLAPNTAGATIITWVADGNQARYAAVITPTTSGEVTFNVAAGVATDAANNPNTASTSQTVTVDVDKPSVTIGVPSGTQTGAFDATITFSETVSGFAQSDVSLSGSTASITGWRANSGNTVYTATITPTSSGSITFDVNAGVATDAANNQNTAATSQTVIVDVDAPGVSVSILSDKQTGVFDATIMFTEAVSGFEQADLSLTGTANASITAWSTTDNTTYIATITPTTEGTVIINVPANVATDAAGNNNSAGTAQIVTVKFKDTEAPTVTINVPADVQNGAFAVSFIFSEAVSVFEDDEVSLTGTASATITAWDTTDKITYTATITPTASGEVIINVPAGIAADANRNPNTAAVPQTVHVDVDRPTVSITAPSSEQSGEFNVTITFSEAVSGFTQSDVSLTGSAASITAWSANSDNTVYTATITPTASGTVTVGVAANVATDAANNSNTAATSKTVTVDVDRPTVSITVPPDVQNGAFDVTITFSEAVIGFVQLELSLSGTAAAGITAWSANTANTVYTATITPTTSGMVTLNIAADVATNAANNQNTAATSQTIAINIPDPDAAVLIPDANLAAAIRKTLGLADDATITVADMRQLIELDAQESDISELTGLEHATNLEKLRLFENSISDISPLSKLTNLTFLNIFDNSISDISPLSKLTNLRGLYLNNNNMSDISISDISPLSELTNLTGLSLAGNNISDISPLSELTNLRGLDLQSIGISDLSSLSGLTNLTYLVIGGNNTGDISWLSELTSLTGLSLALDNRSDISPLSELTSLTGLSLAGNNISDISPLSELTNLEMLYLDNNSISDISPLSELTNLEALYLNNNSISDVSPLSGLTSLRYLTLWYYLILDTSPLYPLLKTNGGSLEYVNIKVSQYPPWDVNEDGSVNAADSALVTAALGQSGTAIVNPRTDVNGDGTVDADDLTLVTDNLDTDNSAPSSMGLFTLLDRETLETLDPTILEAQLEILRTQSDGSLKYLRAIALLESILAALRPDETRLLSNYPNPFNPETWIPYHLANDTDVQLSIYDINGALVRQLDLGYQRTGYYTNRSRAAYWDGRNEFGEQVATGIYFYQLQAGSESFLRKMVILK